jgi:hypothetical protein
MAKGKIKVRKSTTNQDIEVGIEINTLTASELNIIATIIAISCCCCCCFYLQQSCSNKFDSQLKTEIDGQILEFIESEEEESITELVKILRDELRELKLDLNRSYASREQSYARLDQAYARLDQSIESLGNAIGLLAVSVNTTNALSLRLDKLNEGFESHANKLKIMTGSVPALVMGQPKIPTSSVTIYSGEGTIGYETLPYSKSFERALAVTAGHV